MLLLIFKILLIFLCCSYIVSCFIKGYNNVKHLEFVCTEEVTANVEILKTKHFLHCKYYIANFTYVYNDKKYIARKGLFKTLDSNTLTIYINPQNPKECEIMRIRDRIKCCH